MATPLNASCSCPAASAAADAIDATDLPPVPRPTSQTSRTSDGTTPDTQQRIHNNLKSNKKNNNIQQEEIHEKRRRRRRRRKELAVLSVLIMSVALIAIRTSSLITKNNDTDYSGSGGGVAAVLAGWLRQSNRNSNNENIRVQQTKQRQRRRQQQQKKQGKQHKQQKQQRQKHRRLEEDEGDEGEDNQQQEDQENNDQEEDENDNDNDNKNNEDDEEENKEENNDNDDGQQQQQQQRNQNDDDYHAWVDDEVQCGGGNDDNDEYVECDQNEDGDDQEYWKTYAPVYIDDDFYVFPQDPGPPRLFPLTSRDVAAYVLASMGLTLGASGGIGGGGIVVPVYILVAGLTPKMAIPLGAVTVLGGSVASTVINSRRRHPLADRPIIDWDLVLVTEPLTLIGALTGTLLHRILSEKFLIVILVLLLSVSAHSTLAKAKRMYDAESRYIQKLKAVHMSEAQHHHVHVPLTPRDEPRIVPLPTVAKPRRHHHHHHHHDQQQDYHPHQNHHQADPNNINNSGVSGQHPTHPHPPVSGTGTAMTGGEAASEVSGDMYFAARSPSLSPLAGVGTPNGIRGTDDDCFSNVTLNAGDNTTIDNDTSFEDIEDELRIEKTRSEGSTPRQMGVEERQQILILNPDFITLRSGLLEEEKFTPRSKIIALCLMFSTLMFLNIMIGGGAFPSPWGIRCGSVAFWVVQVIMVAFLVASAWAAQTYLVNRHEMKEIVRFDYVHGDIKWDARSAIIYPALFICAGTFAGMFGIGGGMITVPLMLAMGVHPAVVSATSSAMILFTSFASASSYLVFGLILYDYAIVCFVVGFFASLFGNKVMRQARQAKSANGRNFERNSYIAFCIGGVILVSALLMTIDYVFRVYAFDDMDYPEGLCEGYRI